MTQLLKLKILLLAICSCPMLFSQQKSKPKDSSIVYRKIEKYSKKSKFNQFFHKLIFKSVTKQKTSSKSIQKLKKMSFITFEGKIIRSIKIATVDPFGYSEIDTNLVPKTFILKTANAAHLKTKNIAIRNLLLMRPFEKLDSLLVKESERIIRTQKFIRSVTIDAKLTSKDSIDLLVRVIDSWSIIPDLNTSFSVSEFSLKDRNIFGLGHQFSNVYAKSLKDNRSGFSTTYSIPSISTTFIKTEWIKILKIGTKSWD